MIQTTQFSGKLLTQPEMKRIKGGTNNGFTLWSCYDPGVGDINICASNGTNPSQSCGFMNCIPLNECFASDGCDPIVP